MKEMKYADYLKEPEKLYQQCVENKVVVRINGEENSCVMMSGEMWDVFDQTYQLFMEKMKTVVRLSEEAKAESGESLNRE